MSGAKRNLIKKKVGRLSLVDLGFGFGLAAVLAAVFFAVPQVYAKKFLPGVWIGQVPVGAKTQAEAKAKLEKSVTALLDQGLSVEIDGKIKKVPIQQAVTSSDITPPLIEIDEAASLDNAFKYGHAFGLFRNSLQAWRAMIFRKHIEPIYQADEITIENALRKQFGAKDVLPENAHLSYADGVFKVTPEKAGQGYQYQAAIKSALAQWLNLQPAKIKLTSGEEPARINAESANKFIDDAGAIVKLAPLTLNIPEAKAVTLDAAAVGQALDVGLNKKNSLTLVFAENKMQKLIKKIQDQVDVEAKDSRFKMENGRVVEFQQGQVGKQLDVNATLANLNETIINQKKSVAQAEVKTINPISASENAQNLGITELVATGKTNFAGSPTNRRHNIANAAKLLNGLLIKPGEEFSLVAALQPIETSNGYLPELVIKGNRTIPEVGGGLCQVGTTMFRLALNSGLPILERRNHSYRVSYYEPPVGMDATIYDPKPDFRFKNDYASALLLQTRVEGNNLIFDFYGTKDGRSVTLSKPKLFNVTKPPPTQYIKTTDLKPGEKKRLERAHNGGEASFVYSVSKDGKTSAQTFASKYRAWQEVWLVGATAEEVAAES
ncbi:hypothetical protein C4546_00910 [Candidatus Parcubacteria bacterium]|jgi:vancomycin resistance protein YoaR|nr:MAG: hypothetical protein C4546_00910 [Candidatus Parcubacteria bacterium]